MLSTAIVAEGAITDREETAGKQPEVVTTTGDEEGEEPPDDLAIIMLMGVYSVDG